MKKSALTSVLFLLFGCVASAQPIPPDSLYLGQTPPGNIPVIFNLSVSNGSFAAERIAISNDGSEIYYSEVHSYYPTVGDTIRFIKYSGSHWTGPFSLFQNFLAPALSPGGDTLYCQNNSSVYESFFSVRNGSNWSNPQRLLSSLNTAHYLQVTSNGHYYISSISNPGIGAADWCKLMISGNDTTAISLGLPLNSIGNNLDFFVSRDETFMILAKNGLQISYHKPDGNWTNPKNLGAQINFGLGMWGPYVTSDDKYLFYTTGTNPNYSDTYIRWVRIDGLMDSLMHTNFIPYVKNQVPDQTAIKGMFFNFTIPDTTFIDDDGNNTLTYHAKLSNGNPLPAWLIFDTLAGTFTGTPAIIETLNIRITATDTAGASAAVTFKIRVEEPEAIEPGEKQGLMIYPNPGNGLIRVSSDAFNGKPAMLEIRNQEGKVILKNTFKKSLRIDLTRQAPGIYILKLYNGQKSMIGKVCRE